MSILLESLNQAKPSSDGEGANADVLNADVPSIDISHFDDEILSDEWLLKKVKFWKLLAIVFGTLFCASWILYYLSKTDPDVDLRHIKERDQKAVEQIILQQKLQEQSNLQNTQENGELNTIQQQATHIPSSNANAEVSKKAYVPQKRSPTSSHNSQNSQNNSSETPDTVDSADSKDITTSQPTKTKSNVSNRSQTSSQKKAPEDYESLSIGLKSEMPAIEISSYAVSSNRAKSFVVLNGSFYAEGEVIAPNLVLITINKDGIVFKYKNRLIRKKYSL